MARKVVLIDDFDGSDIMDGEGGTVTFSLRDDYFRMDLTNKNYQKLMKALEPFMTKAEKVPPPTAPHARGTTTRQTRTQVPGQGKDYLDAVRRWARDNGKQVADRGRIAASIIEEYEAAKGIMH